MLNIIGAMYQKAGLGCLIAHRYQACEMTVSLSPVGEVRTTRGKTSELRAIL